MDCGIPFCNTGCPLGNLIPDWNDHAFHGRFHDAIESLYRTNNFPEITGRVCPAPCEAACVLALHGAPVSIKLIEREVADRALSNGGLRPRLALIKTDKRVAIVGSGPAGLAAAQELGRAGHRVTVFEKTDRIGGLLTYGIPDFKLEKALVDARVEQLRAEGVEFRTGVEVGTTLGVDELRASFDAICLALGAQKPRDLGVVGRKLSGVYFAM